MGEIKLLRCYYIVWKADSNASGIYFVRMNAAGIDQIQKVILMK